MVTTDLAQLTGECSAWKDALRDFRTEFSELKERLQKLSLNLTDKLHLQDLEHLSNQFYIQLINIHDLKHAIKEHEQIAEWELSKNGQVTDATWAAHEEFNDKFQQLQHTLKSVKEEFRQFVSRLQ
ncbi:hypothetical protein KJS94_04725 [Flavihumibacter rivuli]|uniref:hypothetical protein n=1 Tax=Flavihumibacter rivuli TaxID=2838156 RepID=UPI001BDE1857|nr:hypothetical protein [Flavihumibacter rivuli]ULQ57502.1 hypothetical protein KJS94_04725 [Flavihumibacter rivuli]